MTLHLCDNPGSLPAPFDRPGLGPKMTRLDSVINRLQAQRACIDDAVRRIAGMDGCVLELGLGNGRTFDHLRDRLPGRDIYVFDRFVRSHPDSTPDEAHLFLGDFDDTLPQAAARLGRTAVLAHCDFGSGRPEVDAEMAKRLVGLLRPLLAPGAIVLSDQPLILDGGTPLPLPDGVASGRYQMFQAS